MDRKEVLAKLIADTGAFRYSPDKPFRLASGATSKYYFDLRRLNGDPAGICSVARILYDHAKAEGIKSVGGMESGSISMSAAVAQLSYYENQKDPTNPLVRSFYVRKAPKEHGMRARIEGMPESPVAVVDDVITSGASALAAVDAAREAGYDCKLLMAIVFRGSDADLSRIGQYGKFEYLFTGDDLIVRTGSAG